MKRFVSVCDMYKQNQTRDAFTLIEVMVSVMIISVVIMALLEMFANNTHIFTILKKQTKVNQYSSFLISNDDYGFENKSMHLDDLLNEFNLDDDLRRELKDIKIKVIYQKLETIDMSKENIETNLNIVLEIGKNIIKTDDSSTYIFRSKIK